MKKTILIPLIIILALSLCSCSSSDNSGGKECIVDFFGNTYYEDSVLYFDENSEGETILYCYSKDTDTSAVMCSLPECTHARKTSPDCVALSGDETLDERGYNIIGDKMYYISVKTFDEDAKGSIDLMECDLDGRNKRVAASIENKIAPFISDVKYSDNNVYITYIQKYDFVKDEDTGKFDFVDLDKSEFYIQKVEIPTGSIETLVYREDYDGGGYGAVYDNVLYYYYSYYTEKSTGEMITPDTKPRTSKIAFYIKDLTTCEEKEYQDMSLLGAKLGHFSSDRIMVYDNKNKKLLRFYTETEKFEEISDFDYSSGGYTEDENYAAFGSGDNEGYFSIYNFESGEISQIPYPSDPKINLNLVHIVGDTVWLDIGDDDLYHAYISREDFYAGKFENISKIKEVDWEYAVDGDPKPQPSDTTAAETDKPVENNSDVTVIKWGVAPFSHDENEPFELLNKQLEAEGSNIRVECVILRDETEYDPDDKDNLFGEKKLTFADLIKDYEKENGSLDIVTYGPELFIKIGTAYDFIKSGYFRELSEENMAQFTDIPEVYWNAAAVDGKHYTVPALSMGGFDYKMTFNFNTKYISEDKIKNFGGNISELEDILSGVTVNENMVGLHYGMEYLDYLEFDPASTKGGLYLSDKTMKAMNPYEAEEVIEYARELNKLYNKGYINYEKDFSGVDLYNYPGVVRPEIKEPPSDFAVYVAPRIFDEEDFTKMLGKDHKVISYSLPYYEENRILRSTGIPVKSNHPDEAMELLRRLHFDKSLSDTLCTGEKKATGLRINDDPVYYDEYLTSPFAGFELNYQYIDFELEDTLGLCYDRLCKAEDFDKTLEEIRTELKAAGIDDYVAKVNQRLEEWNAASSQQSN